MTFAMKPPFSKGEFQQAQLEEIPHAYMCPTRLQWIFSTSPLKGRTTFVDWIQLVNVLKTTIKNQNDNDPNLQQWIKLQQLHCVQILWTTGIQSGTPKTWSYSTFCRSMHCTTANQSAESFYNIMKTQSKPVEFALFHQSCDAYHQWIPSSLQRRGKLASVPLNNITIYCSTPWVHPLRIPPHTTVPMKASVSTPIFTPEAHQHCNRMMNLLTVKSMRW